MALLCCISEETFLQGNQEKLHLIGAQQGTTLTVTVIFFLM